jgi:phosphomevalonate kinase
MLLIFEFKSLQPKRDKSLYYWTYRSFPWSAFLKISFKTLMNLFKDQIEKVYFYRFSSSQLCFQDLNVPIAGDKVL